MIHGNYVNINVNNHYEGCAPLTIQKVQKLLQPLALEIPVIPKKPYNSLNYLVLP